MGEFTSAEDALDELYNATPSDPYDDLHGNDEANALYAIAEEIIRLDHHRDGGGE